MDASNLPPNKGYLLIVIREQLQPLRQYENWRKARRAEKCKRLVIFINPTPRVGRARYQAWTKLHLGNSP